ncbi:GntR family transcriptional regulator [Virgibacillus sp. NKC19-16]|uniref:GntR family transcriptional regulator n=1 Tax=Virgibacillus salidurans TaxID=2831673 RepID=UPI001F36F3B1|nr:GntR family transcriptional regulator [Virgibacillus sp. NKC19-16]UJL46177.1 GntR family transcriptional regulator [Virgibacillus sp. NKC19-16]
MLIHVSQASPKPMYEQVVEEIQRLIVAGEMEPGEMLPSIRELSKELTTSGITIRRAYQELELIGFIYTRKGKGSFVSALSEERLSRWKMEQVREPLLESVLRAKELDLNQEQFQNLINDLWQKTKRQE